MKLPSTLRFADEQIKEAFYKLENGDSIEKELFKTLNQALDNIEKNSFCGIQVPNIWSQRSIYWNMELRTSGNTIYQEVGG